MESLILSNIDNALSNYSYKDYLTIRDDDDTILVIKQGRNDFLVEDASCDSKYFLPKATLNVLENNPNYDYEEEEIFNLLVIIYRAYESYNAYIEETKATSLDRIDEVSKEEILMSEMDQDNIIDILSELMRYYDYERIARAIHSKTDKEIVELFYLSGIEGKTAALKLVRNYEKNYGYNEYNDEYNDEYESRHEDSYQYVKEIWN